MWICVLCVDFLFVFYMCISASIHLLRLYKIIVLMMYSHVFLESAPIMKAEVLSLSTMRLLASGLVFLGMYCKLVLRK